MDKDNKVAVKTSIYSTLFILMGYAFLKIPVLGFIVECIILLMVFSYLYEAISEVLYHQETQKEINKSSKNHSKKKGK